MDSLGFLLGVNKKQALEFFYTHLKDICYGNIEPKEVLFNASILAHYASTSSESSTDLPLPSDLGVIFDKTVLGTYAVNDPTLCTEIAGQLLVLSGFFWTQLERRHNLNWYAKIGAGCFEKASRLSKNPAQQQMFETMHCNFNYWRRKYRKLNEVFEDLPYLLH